MTRRFDGDVSISGLPFFVALFLTSWASADVVAQDTWKTSSGKRVVGVPVGVGYDHASHEQTFIFEVDGKQTVRVLKSAFSDSAAEKIEATIKVNSVRRAAERHAEKKHQQYEAAKAVLLEEEQKNKRMTKNDRKKPGQKKTTTPGYVRRHSWIIAAGLGESGRLRRRTRP